MSEIFIAFMGLGLITTLQFFIVVNCLDKIEEKINVLKGQQNGDNN